MTEEMSFIRNTSFRFCNLPLEKRRKVYRELLCTFEPTLHGTPETLLQEEPTYKRGPIRCYTANLRTNKAIYREAYDVMVKTNWVVKNTTGCGLPGVLKAAELWCHSVVFGNNAVEKIRDTYSGSISRAQHLTNRLRPMSSEKSSCHARL
jgi:hypothetical protein